MTFKTAKETYPPQVTTEGASSVTTSSAVLTGYLDGTGGETCQVWFDYGTTTSYGSSTSKLSVSSTGPFSAPISTLNPDTTYHFRACAQNSKGTSYGSDMTFTTTSDQVVTFPDPNLEALIREAIGKPIGDIYQSDLEVLTGLAAEGKSISNLNGLEYCVNLKNLGLYDNQISDLSPLSNLAKLERLSLGTNEIATIEAISSLTNLRDLELDTNQITDIQALTDVTGLVQLSLSYNQITDIQPLSNLTALRTLNLISNQITNIEPLASLTNLEELGLGFNQISNIQPVSGLISLRYLHLGPNLVQDIGPLANLTNLRDLSLGSNYIGDVQPLAGLISLELLFLVNNQITDIQALANNTNLAELYLGFNEISDISALVANPGLSDGDIVNLQANPLSNDSLNTYIPQLEARGVNVLYDTPKTWHVDDDLVDYPAADFTKIQDAVDAASYGDTIIVYPGTYTENVDVDKDHLIIQSANGAESTIVQAANPSGNVFEVAADYVEIKGFTAGGGLRGIYLHDVDSCQLSSNKVSDNGYGIHLDHSSGDVLAQNTASNNDAGIRLDYSPNSILNHNTASNSGNLPGISFFRSPNCTLISNVMSDNVYNFHVYGGELFDYSHNIDTSNIVNGKPIQYISGQHGLIIDSSWNIGYLALVNCTDITVKGLTLTHNWEGIQLAYSSSSRIEGVTMSYNWDGIYLRRSDNNIVINSIATHNINGITLESSVDNLLADNIASSNIWSGIHLRSSQSNAVTSNTVTNRDSGIWMEFSTDNALTNNTASNNERGIDLYYSLGNLVYLNNFVDNIENTRSHESATTWNSPEEIIYTYNDNVYTNYLGNYWGDYLGSDVGGDGIGETPYPIDSDADNYPLVMPFENYIGAPTPEWRKDIQPGDILYDVDSTCHFEIGDFTFTIGHIGMYIGDLEVGGQILHNQIIEADGSDGVHLDDIESWDYPNRRNVYLLRVNCAEAIKSAAIEFAKGQLGKPYDYLWVQKSSEPNSPSWYCSELVWAAYFNQGVNLQHIPHPEPVTPVEIFADDDVSGIDSHLEEEFPDDFWTIAFCPVDLMISDQDGHAISKEGCGIPGALYIQDDLNGDGYPDDLVYIPQRQIGDYQINVIPDSDASSTDTYSLQASTGDTTIILADNVQIGDIPSRGYTIRSTETEIVQIVPSEFCFIATAAYGTPMAQEVQTLRDFRDQYLLTNPLGQAFVDFYYKVSPPAASFISDHPSLKPMVRVGLVPAVAFSTVVVNTTTAEKAAIVGLLALVSVAVAIWVTRRRGRGPQYT